MVRRSRGRRSIWRVVLLLALGALFGQPCAVEGSDHRSMDPALWAGPVDHGTGGGHPAIHAASCEGLKPAATAVVPPAVESRPPVVLGAALTPSPKAVDAASGTGPPLPLFLLHGALLI